MGSINLMLLNFRITVTGIYRASASRVNPKQRNLKSVYRTHIDVVHFRKIDTKRLYEDFGSGYVIFSETI